MNEDRTITSLGWNDHTGTIDVVSLDDKGNATFMAHLCPAHPIAIDAVIAGLEEIKVHLQKAFEEENRPLN